MNEELQQLVDSLTKRVKTLEEKRDVSDHFHNGFDSSRVRVRDLDTVFYAQSTIDPSSLVDGAGETITATVTGATLGDFVLVAPPYTLQGITVTAWVSANSQVSVRVQNESGGVVDLASGIWRFLIIRKIV